MRLRELLRDLPVSIGSADPDVVGLNLDSRRVAPGDLFVAVPGALHDGRAFASDAEGRGAVAVLGTGESPRDLSVPWISHPDPRAVLAPLAARVYGHPERRLRLVGVTGTNGKSTVVALAASVLEAAEWPTGRIGTLGMQFGDWTSGSERTTPEAPDLFRALGTMVDRGAESAVIEVSSHALEMGRLDGLAFDAAAFTNLSHDHLDFHGDLETYFRSKKVLFDRLRERGAAVIWVEDDRGARLAAELRDRAIPVLACGRGGDLDPVRVEADLEGLRIEVDSPEGFLEIRSSLRGSWNVANLVVAAGLGRALGAPDTAIQEGLARVAPLSGRMEPVDRGQGFPVFVDYAHTPAALESALGALRALIGEGKIAVVFGCGGDRDREKRRPMGAIAGRGADLPIATSDNPRGEDPLRILSDVERGLRDSGNGVFEIETDRRSAITRAVECAQRGVEGGEAWAVLIAGKGHESTQTIGDQVLRFSDREVVGAALDHLCAGEGATGGRA